METTPQISGLPGADAVASKRGYFYQDLVTSLAWTKLGDNEILYVETAEDMAIARSASAEIHQIRNVARPLTISLVLPFLENVLRLQARNSSLSLEFFYATTAEIGLEKSALHRIADTPTLQYWDLVRRREQPLAPLVGILRRLSSPTSLLGTLVQAQDEEEIRKRLITPVYWLVGEAPADHLEQELEDQLATIAHKEFGLDPQKGRSLVAQVVLHVIQTSIRANPDERVLKRIRLLDLIVQSTKENVALTELQALRRDAALIRNLPVTHLDTVVEERLDKLTKTRFFQEAKPNIAANELASDVTNGGRFEAATAEVRGRALVWCARLVAMSEPRRAKDEVLQAESLPYSSPHLELVKALLTAQTNATEALRGIRSDQTGIAQTIRFIIWRINGTATALDQVQDLTLAPVDFDTDGQFMVLMGFLEEGRWTQAVSWFERIPEESIRTCPALSWASGLTLVCWATPEEVRRNVANGIPIVGELPLKVGAEYLDCRRRAITYFRRFAEQAKDLGIGGTADEALQYALWLGLEDRTTRSAAISEISGVWSDSKNDVRWLPLALRAGLSIDKATSLQMLLRRAKQFGSLNLSESRALAALLVRLEPGLWMEDWPTIRLSIAQYFSTEFLVNVEVSALLEGNRVSEARSVLAGAPAIDSNLRLQLEDLIEEAEGRPSELPPQTDHSVPTLQHAADSFNQRCAWKDLKPVAKELFDKTRTVEAAQYYVHAALEEWDLLDVAVFMETEPDLLDQSNRLTHAYFNALFRLGRWSDAEQLLNERADAFVEHSEVRLQLASHAGQWERLGLLLEQEQYVKERLSAKQLLQRANLSRSLGRASLSINFTRAAVAISADDPHVLANAYYLAVKGRWEHEDVVADWLNKAVQASSSDDGPFQQKSLSDLIEYAPRWQEHTNRLSRGLQSGVMMLALAAEHVNQPLAAITLVAGWDNLKRRNPADRGIITAFSGRRRTGGETAPKRVVIDITTLLTLSALDLLPLAGRLFSRIHVPYATGIWLLQEYGRIQFHQPSRVFDARSVLHAITRQEIEVAKWNAQASLRLRMEVGSELAELLTAADEDTARGTESFVIKTAPIHRVGSLLSENADVGEGIRHLRSTLALAKSLRFAGAITDEDHRRMEAFLRTQDLGWEGEGVLPAGATVYIDDVALGYFLHLGALQALTDGGFKVKVHPKVRDQANAFDQLDESSVAASQALESIRRFLVEGQEAGTVLFLPRPRPQEEGAELESSEALDLVGQLFVYPDDAEAVFIDDRAMNRHQTITYEDGRQLPIFHTLDFLDWARRANEIDASTWLKSRTELRRRGYVAMPVTLEEIERSVNDCVVQNGMLIESVEARAIRENVALSQIGNALILPEEGDSISARNSCIQEVIQDLWRAENASSSAAARSTWLVDLSRLDGFANQLTGNFDADRWNDLDAMTVARPMLVLDLPPENVRQHNDWIESAYLDDLRGRPEVFTSLCSRIRALIAELPAMAASRNQGPTPDQGVQGAAAVVAGTWIRNLPSAVREWLLLDGTLASQLGLTRSSRVTIPFEPPVRFDFNDLYEAAFKAAQQGNAQVEDSEGKEWAVREERSEGFDLACECPEDARKFSILHGAFLSPDLGVRSTYFASLLSECGLARTELPQWIASAVERGPLSAEELRNVDRELQVVPRYVAERVCRELQSGKVGIWDLVPLTKKYYEYLLEPWAGEVDLPSYAESLFKRLADERNEDRLLNGLLWSAHRLSVPVELIVELNAESLCAWVEEWRPRLDTWSLTGLLEAVLQRDDALTDLEQVVSDLVKQFCEVAVKSSARVSLAASLFSLTDGALQVSRMFSATPPFYRRLVSISHAALLERAVIRSGISYKTLVEWANQFYPRFQAATLCDLQTEPRWTALLGVDDQLRQEFIGRIDAALTKREAELATCFERNSDLQEQVQSLRAANIPFLSCLPGPLEGSTQGLQELPREFSDQIETALEDDEIPLLQRVFACAHLICLGRVPETTVAAIAATLKALTQVDAKEDDDALANLTLRVSYAASASRSSSLAEAAREWIRSRPAMSLAVKFEAGMIVCGAVEDPNEWRDAVVDHCAWISHGELSKNDAGFLLRTMTTISHVQPTLRLPLTRLLCRLTASALRAG